ncbi:MAG: rhamnan synthesis F family protein [Lachnospiraceae bacterium]
MKSQSIQRLCIIHMKDNTDIIDNYMYFLLESLQPFVDKFMIFCGTKVRNFDLERLAKYTHGDVPGRYDNVNPSDIKQYSNVLLIDDSFFGPLYTLVEMFEEMGHRQVDYWGVTQSPETIDIDGRCHCSELHSYFLMLNETALANSDVLTLLCEKIQEQSIADQLIHCLKATKLHWESYIDTSCYEVEAKEKNIDPSLLLSYELVKLKRCPFITKDSLLYTSYVDSTGENARNALDFINEKLDYDCKLIWQSLLREYNVLDIKEALHLEYIFPWKIEKTKEQSYNQIKAAVIVHLYYMEMLEDCFSYIGQIPKEIDIYITTSSEALKARIENLIRKNNMQQCHVLLKENRGRDVSALLVACKDILLKYDYLCFVHDKKSDSYLKSMTSGKSYMYGTWENTIKSHAYVHNVIQCFEDNPCLGFLTPPEPYQDVLLGNLGRSWAGSFSITQNLAQQLDLRCNLEPEKPPIAVSTTFWCRTKALYPLFKHIFQYTDFQKEPMNVEGTISHAIERIFPYVAQSEGYYTGIMMNSDYASLRGTALQALLVKTLDALRKEHIVLDIRDVDRLEEHTETLLRFVKHYAKIYIYGAGNYGHICANAIIKHGQRFDGYIVSDGEMKNSDITGTPVYYISEIHEPPESCGIVVAMNVRYQKDVTPKLERLGFRNRYYI